MALPHSSSRPLGRVAWFATQGDDSNDAGRMRELLAGSDAVPWSFNRDVKALSARCLLARTLRERPDLVVMEGTGLGGGLSLIAASAFLGQRYVVSSGDAVGPYFGLRGRAFGVVGGMYERLLCRRAAGWIGWSPYIVGRALTLGAPRGVTAPGWGLTDEDAAHARTNARTALGIPEDALVAGLVGSLNWNAASQWCYGLELIRAARMTNRSDLHILIVGDGSGLERLRAEAAGVAAPHIHLVGRKPRTEIPALLTAMDVASLPQTVDGVGAFRYTTKLFEYLAAGLPVITSRIPAAYDLDEGWLWRLPGDTPWSEAYVGALASLLTGLDTEVVARRAAAANRAASPSLADQRLRVQTFLADLVG